MKKTTRPTPSNNRWSWPLRRKGSVAKADPGTLLASAGKAPSFESLEQRQLLFTLTVNPSDPSFIDEGNGYGTVEAVWAYFLPATIRVGDVQDPEVETIEEDFDQDDPGVPVFPIPNNFQFQGSNLRVSHNVSTLQLERTSPGNQPPNLLRASMQDGQSIVWSAGSTNQPNSPGALMSRFQIEIGGTGFNLNNITVQILGPNNTVLEAFTGNTLGQQNVTAPGTGVGTFRFIRSTGAAFNAIRILSNSQVIQTFLMDNVVFDTTANQFGEVMDRDVPAVLRFTAPLGATAVVTDLYGRDMIRTLAVGPLQNGSVPGDPNNDGIPDFNDGIGKIVMTGTDQFSTMTLIGGELQDTITPQAYFVQGGIGVVLPTNLLGTYDSMEERGFGLAWDIDGDELIAIGLPPGPGSVVVGSPLVRDINNYNPGAGAFPGLPRRVLGGNYVNPDQGIFVENGSIGSVWVHGMLFGVSVFDGSVGRFNVGQLYGSMSVAGDLGSITVGSDAGASFLEPSDTGASDIRVSGSEIIVGRSLGSMDVGATMYSKVIVQGNINSPSTAPPRPLVNYFEKEYSYGFDPQTPDGPRVTINRTLQSSDYMLVQANPPSAQVFENYFDVINGVLQRARFGQGQIFGAGYFRNDSLLAAEWVSSLSTGVKIFGDLGNWDPISPGDDPVDAYAFASDGNQPIAIEITSAAVYARLVDEDGRVVAATNSESGLRINYNPTRPGVYFLILATPDNDAPNPNAFNPYEVTIVGMAPTMLGSVRTALNFGGVSTQSAAGIQVAAGNMGWLRAGTGRITGNNQIVDNEDITNAPFAEAGAGSAFESSRNIASSSVSVAGNLFAIATGDDIEGTLLNPATFNIGGNLGVIRTGMRDVGNVDEGDLRNTRITTGGSIGLINVQAGQGIDSDGNVPRPGDGPLSIQITTGTNKDLRGDIGLMRFGNHAGANTMLVKTSAGSIVGGYLVSQDIVEEPGALQGIYGPGVFPNNNGTNFQLGFGSDLRFFDSPRIDYLNLINQTTELPQNVPVIFTDDAGGQVEVTIVAPTGSAANGRAIVIPVSGSKGVALGRINVDLTGGARLRIRGLGAAGNKDVISIGRIIVTGADGNDGVQIEGNTQIDVWKIDYTATNGGQVGVLHEVINRTPGGDIVAIDATQLDRIEITSGDLGRTQVPAWGPRLLGPYLGLVANSAGGEIGSAIGVGTPGSGEYNNAWTGQILRPINNNDDETSFLDDVGSPVDPYLNGAIIRTGNVTLVSVGGGIGDVLAIAGQIVEVRANNDLTRLNNQFDGIFGNIFALRISLVDVGDGMLERTESPLSNVGIVARDDIFRIVGNRVDNANISGLIAASNNTVGNTLPNNFPTDGIDSITLTRGGDFYKVSIGGMSMDFFWLSAFANDGALYRGQVTSILGTDADFAYSTLQAAGLTTLRLTNGAYDASQVEVSTAVNLIEAREFKNSSIDGSFIEYRPAFIQVAGDINTIQTIGKLGDMSDIRIDTSGRTNILAARNLSRVTFGSDFGYNTIEAQTIRGSEIAGAEIDKLTAADIRSSEISISGAIKNITVTNEITNSLIQTVGPDGRIDKITVANRFTGAVAASGPIDTIEVTNGDLDITLTTNDTDGNIKLIKAGRDLILRSDVSGTIETLDAGRHIGSRTSPGVILVRGNIKDISAPNGQLYSDVRIGQNLTGRATIGRAVNFPQNSNIGAGSILAFGRIETVEVLGDFGGSILSYSGGIGVVTVRNGSLLPSSLIASYDGSITSVFVIGGDLLGDIHADQILQYIRVEPTADGVFGDVGVNPTKSAAAGYDAFRNQLPPGVVATNLIDGPKLTAGWNFGRIDVVGGSMFDTHIQAGRAIGTINVSENIQSDGINNSGLGRANVIAAGSLVFRVLANNMLSTSIVSGVRSFGADERPGGTGVNADTITVGRINNIFINGNANNSTVSAGVDAGVDGLYNTNDDRVVLGNSFVRNVTVGGSTAGFSVFSDRGVVGDTGTVPYQIGGTNLPHADPLIVPGGNVGIQIPNTGAAVAFTYAGGSGNIAFTGPGKAFFDAATGRLILVNTTTDSGVTVNTANGLLTDFNVVSNDDASVGTITINGSLLGNSNVVIDGFVVNFTVGNLDTTGRINTGNNIRFFNAQNVVDADIAFILAREFNVASFGTPTREDDARVDALASNFVNIAGNFSGIYNIERDVITSFTIGGAMEAGNIRSGASIPKMTIGSMSKSRISVRDRLVDLTVTGGANESAIIAGGDLGSDAVPGGTGFNADVVTNGEIGKVTIGGDFAKSSIIAGSVRGVDGFFGTTDDSTAGGRSNIGTVTIGGTNVGSNNFSEQYRIAATGTIGAVTIGGSPGTNQGNFRIEQQPTQPQPIQVRSLDSRSQGQIFVTTITFNQPMDASSIGPALTIREVRGGGATLLSPLVEGQDYVIEYDATLNTAVITFSTTLTSRGLPQQPNVSGPGMYRFDFDAEVLRAQIASARLDGNNDGFAVVGEDFSRDSFVGDAGDKLVAEQILLPNNGGTYDMYGPVDLDLAFDAATVRDGLPDPNRIFTLFGAIGDHPDQNVGFFKPGSDVDVYKITLQAGQILRLGAMAGSGLNASRFLTDAQGQILGAYDSAGRTLNYSVFDPSAITTPDTYLITQTGTYYIVLDNTVDSYNNPGELPNLSVIPSAIGGYEFTVEVFDDGDSGFKGDTNAGNGQPVAYAPGSGVFVGNDGQLGTADDLAQVIVGEFTFRYDRGPDGIAGTADDIVSGDNGKGVSSTRTNGKITSTINSSIGTPGHFGIPGEELQPDVDIFHLNNGIPIAPNVKLTVTVRLADLGSDLGSRREGAPLTSNFAGGVQFGVFDSTAATNAINGQLLLSPSDFAPTARTPNTIIAQNESTTYGFDDRGDFYITFANPGRLGSASAPAELAVYLQGVFRTDYQIEIVQQGTANPVKKTQNVLIETNGGVIDWLLASGRQSQLAGFDPAALGFSGTVGGKKVKDYILQEVVSRLNSIYANAGLDVNISLNPIDFENQPFSTVFLTNSIDSVNRLDASIYGVSQHSDALNADLNDDAVVFVPSLFNIDPRPDQAGVDAFVNQLSAAVGRRVGELMGLRLTTSDFGSPTDIQAANSVFASAFLGSSISSSGRDLASPLSIGGTEFFLGQQTALSLLDKLLK